VLDIYVGCILHPFSYTLVRKLTLVINCILASGMLVVENMK
jgi:hypothetical protein